MGMEFVVFVNNELPHLNFLPSTDQKRTENQRWCDMCAKKSTEHGQMVMDVLIFSKHFVQSAESYQLTKTRT